MYSLQKPYEDYKALLTRVHAGYKLTDRDIAALRQMMIAFDFVSDQLYDAALDE